MIDQIRFEAIENLLHGRNPDNLISLALVRERLLIKNPNGSLKPTDKGMSEWRLFRIIPGIISLEQATLLTGLWQQVTSEDLRKKLDPSLIFQIGEQFFLEERQAIKMFGPEHPESRILWWA